MSKKRIFIFATILLASVSAFSYYQFQNTGTSLLTKVEHAIHHDGEPELEEVDITRPTKFGWEATVQSYAEDISDPYGMAYDQAGNLYVVDAGDDNRILKITQKGAVSVLAGEGEGFADSVSNAPDSKAQFHTPSSLVIDAQGNLIVADTGNNAIRKITPAGHVTTIAGNGVAGYVDGPALQAQFNGPMGLALDQEGRIYVADTYNDRIRVIDLRGMVTTLAGSVPSYSDGIAQEAKFNTPTNLVMTSKQELIVADTKNNAIRKIILKNTETEVAGTVTTIAMSQDKDDAALMYRPMALAITHDDYIYVGELSKGRILQLSTNGIMLGLTGVDISIIPGDDTSLRLKSPAAMVVDRYGNLVVADASKQQLWKISQQENKVTTINVSALLAKQIQTQTQTISTTAVTAQNEVLSEAKKNTQLWPFYPQDKVHEVVGTLGEVRGDYRGESRHHFHRGLDIQAETNTEVLVIKKEKISSPLPTWGTGKSGEGIRLKSLAYIHMQVGRDVKNRPMNENKFTIINNEKGKPEQVRVKRGTRFEVGEAIGTVNMMRHIHLNYYEKGEIVNALDLGFIGFVDNIEPLIFGIELYDQFEQVIAKQKKETILRVSRSLEKISIVVDAADQVDGNAARRRLGLYELGYQILNADGTPLQGYEKPINTVKFNQLPTDEEAVKVTYAAESGISVHGSARTRFLYNVSHEVKNGYAKMVYWDIKNLPAGDYIVRITAKDYAGNMAQTGRDLLVRLE